MNTARLFSIATICLLMISTAQAFPSKRKPSPAPHPTFGPIETALPAIDSEGTELMTFDPSITEAVIINHRAVCKRIDYPTYAIEHGIEGTVRVRILVDEQGRYVRHVILEDPHTILTAAVEAELPRLSCLPALKDDMPTRAWLTVPFRFRLIP